MELGKGTIIEKKYNRYVVLDSLFFENNEYIFVNKLRSDLTAGDAYYILKVLDGDVEFEYNDYVVGELLPQFYNNLSISVGEDFSNE